MFCCCCLSAAPAGRFAPALFHLVPPLFILSVPKLRLLSEIIAESRWRTMGWVCDQSPNARLETLRHVFQMEKYVLVETCESPPHVGGLKRTRWKLKWCWRNRGCGTAWCQSGKGTRTAAWFVSAPGPLLAQQRERPFVEQRLRNSVHCVNLHAHLVAPTV